MLCPALSHPLLTCVLRWDALLACQAHLPASRSGPKDLCYGWRNMPRKQSGRASLESPGWHRDLVRQACVLKGQRVAQAAGDEAVRAALPDATIFKPAHMVGTEDRLYNNFAQLAKVPTPSCSIR